MQSNGVPLGAKWQPKFELFDIVADPFEEKDLAAEKPEEVEKLKKEYEAWFADVTKKGFAPPRIIVGSEKENPVRLSRQDWRGPKAAWTPESGGALGGDDRARRAGTGHGAKPSGFREVRTSIDSYRPVPTSAGRDWDRPERAADNTTITTTDLTRRNGRIEATVTVDGLRGQESLPGVGIPRANGKEMIWRAVGFTPTVCD